MKKALAILLAVLLLVLPMTGCGKKVVIGINQYGEHASLDNCREGFLAGLAEAGLEEGKDFTVNYQNAGFNDTTALQIAQNFSARGCTMMVGIATNSAAACFSAAEDKDIPVVFVAVSDPVASNLDEGNITGVSDALPVSAQLELIRALQPDAKTIGIIYTLSESNSVSTVETYKSLAADYGFTIEAVGITQQSQAVQGADTLIAKKVDCFTNLTDNNVVGVLASILEKTDEAGIPVYGSEIEQVKLGCVASAGIDYVKLGAQTGRMAARILAGEKAEDIPFETVEEYSLYVNQTALDSFGITVPADLAGQVEVVD